MYFGELPLVEAEGAILAHSRQLEKRRLKKGRVLDADDIAALAAAGISRIVCARPATGDIAEDRAADLLAAACGGAHVRAGAAFTGRANLFAEQGGIVLYDRARLDGFNLVDESITLGLVPPCQAVAAGQMIATLKIIPFAVPGALVRQAESLAGEGGPLLCVQPFAAPRTVLVQTRLPGMKESILDATLRVTADRLGALGGPDTSGAPPLSEIRCAHEIQALAATLEQAVMAKPGLILISGASAVVDRRDVIPGAIGHIGGEVVHFGMPVDPGNLMLIGRIGAIPVIGMPGCARSPKLNGFDWVLQRLCAGLDISPRDIMQMGAGGLLKDVAHRPLPRASARQPEKKSDHSGEPAGAAYSGVTADVTAIVLAAGRSTRMGAANKLLSNLGGKTMIRSTVEAALASRAERVLVVTGHEAERIRAALAGLDVGYVHNPHHADGLSASLRAGIAALPESVDAALICLGDMPLVGTGLLDRLIAAFDPAAGRAIVVPVQDGRRGNPVLWDRRFFTGMKDLQGDRGARALLAEFADLVHELDIAEPDAGIHLDIDTPEMLAAMGGTPEGATGKDSPEDGTA